MADKSDSKPEKSESKLTSEKRIESTELALQNPKRFRNWQQQMPLEMKRKMIVK